MYVMLFYVFTASHNFKSHNFIIYIIIKLKKILECRIIYGFIFKIL